MTEMSFALMVIDSVALIRCHLLLLRPVEYLGTDTISGCHLASIVNPIVIIRLDHLIYTKAFPILVRRYPHVESGPYGVVLKQRPCEHNTATLPTPLTKVLSLHSIAIIIRTTTMPASPTDPCLPILVIHIRSQVKRRQSQSYKNCEELTSTHRPLGDVQVILSYNFQTRYTE